VNLKAPFGIEGYSLTCKILCNSGYFRYLEAGKRFFPKDKTNPDFPGIFERDVGGNL
jgi:hypothetical protein